MTWKFGLRDGHHVPTIFISFHRRLTSDLKVQRYTRFGSCSVLAIILTKRKVFFFIATLLNKGSVTLDKKELEDYAWLDKEELKGVFSPQYYEAVKNILVH